VGALLMVAAIPLPWAEAQGLDRRVHATGTDLTISAIWTAAIAALLVACWVWWRVRGSILGGVLALPGCWHG
jgi:hypothetical protein